MFSYTFASSLIVLQKNKNSQIGPDGTDQFQDILIGVENSAAFSPENIDNKVVEYTVGFIKFKKDPKTNLLWDFNCILPALGANPTKADTLLANIMP